MSFRGLGIRESDLDGRVAALELKLITVESHARQAWEAEQRRQKASHDFWWTAFRIVAIAQIVIAYALLLFGKR